MRSSRGGAADKRGDELYPQGWRLVRRPLLVARPAKERRGRGGVGTEKGRRARGPRGVRATARGASQAERSGLDALTRLAFRPPRAVQPWLQNVPTTVRPVDAHGLGAVPLGR